MGGSSSSAGLKTDAARNADCNVKSWVVGLEPVQRHLARGQHPHGDRAGEPRFKALAGICRFNEIGVTCSISGRSSE